MNPYYTSQYYKRNTQPKRHTQTHKTRTHNNTRTNHKAKPTRLTNLSGLRCVSHNINGINNPQKRDEIIHKYIIEQIDVICLIHARLHQSKQKHLENKYRRKYDIVLNSNPQRGILILIRNNRDIQWKELHRRDDGNLISIEFKFDNKTFVTHFAYAPSTDNTTRIDFFKHIEQKMDETNAEMSIVTGDLNVILNNKNKINYLTTPHAPTVQHVKNFINKKGLTDISIHKNMHTPHITWTSYKKENDRLRTNLNNRKIAHNKPLKQKAQLDYVLATNTLTPYITDYNTRHNLGSDHEALEYVIDFSNFHAPPKTFKFNDNDLRDPAYKSHIDSLIDIEVSKSIIYTGNKTYHDAPAHIKNTFIQRLNYSTLGNKRFKLTYTKLVTNILEEAMLYTKQHHKQKNISQEQQLRQIITNQNNIQEALNKDPDNQELQAANEQAKLTVQNELTDITQNLRFTHNVHTKCEGEKINPFLCASAKQKQSTRYISKLTETDKHGQQTTITSQPEVLNTVTSFYQQLYTSKKTHKTGKIKKFLNNLQLPKLTQEQSHYLDRPITIDDITHVLKKTKKRSAPGLDGMGYGFYKAFWHKLKFLILGMINEIFEENTLPRWLREGVLSLIPKGDKDRNQLKNWRPLVLLNCLYKIISGTIAKRLNSVLSKLISPRQNGFVPTRCISDCLRSTADMIEFVNRKKIKGLLLLIDFKKAFDSIEHEYIEKILRAYNFGDGIRRWISILLKDFVLCTSNGGHKSDFFDMQRGCRQGDPISSALFVLTIEALSLKLNNSGIKGIDIHKHRKNNIDSLFADDITLYLERTNQDLRKALVILNDFKDISGLEIQTEKTVCVKIGPPDDIHYCSDVNLTWDTKFKLLGITFDNKLEELNKNIDEKLKDIQKDINHWEYKYLSPIGRANIASTYMMSKINHIAFTYPIPTSYINKIDKLIYDFIWQNRAHDRKTEVQAAYDKGGLNFPNISSNLTSFTISWTRRIFNKRHCKQTTWTNILETNLNEIGYSLNTLINAGDEAITDIARKIENPFWKHYFNTLANFTQMAQLKNINCLLNSNIWTNHIFCNSTNLLNHHHKYSELHNKISHPRQLVRIHRGKTIYKTESILAREFNLNRLGKDQVKELKIQITKLMKESRLTFDQFKHNQNHTLFSSIAQMQNKGCNKYTHIIKFFSDHNSNTLPNILQHRLDQWNLTLNQLGYNPIDMEYLQELNKNLTSLQYDMYHRYIQYKINKGTLKTNRLIRFHKDDTTDGLCTFCNSLIESIPHLFWECRAVKSFLRMTARLLNDFWPQKLNSNTLNMKTFIFGDLKSWHSPFNFTNSLIKHYIWEQRKQKSILSASHFIIHFKKQVKEWYKAQTMPESNVNLNFLLKPEYRNIIKNW